MGLINSFAVVSYMDHSIADLVERVRQEVMPGRLVRAHITVLPPRPLYVPTPDAIAQCREIAGRSEAFEVRLGSVDLFADTQVIKLSVEQGVGELKLLHDILNTGPFEHVEDFDYVPHITLAQELTPEKVAPSLEVARRHWAELGPAPRICVEWLTFVQQNSNGSWHNLAELPLGSLEPAGRPNAGEKSGLA